MTAIVYLGDEAHAAAWRLVGVAVEVLTPDTDVLQWVQRRMFGADVRRPPLPDDGLQQLSRSPPRLAEPGPSLEQLSAPGVIEQPQVILLAPAAAARLPAADLARLQRVLIPLLLVLPDAAIEATGSDLARRVRAQLGMAQ